ncbi:uncharacterized protein JCM6883_001968 [Sporobolomyces salmoneus]|uniref:uncharacterized protein n=1 Tax=Sporobolomyces salmoneus TaxID=183962 RepID=UPI003174A768
MYSTIDSTILSGTVPLPSLPSTPPTSRRYQSTSSSSAHSHRQRRISLPSTSQDPFLSSSTTAATTKGRLNDDLQISSSNSTSGLDQYTLGGSSRELELGEGSTGRTRSKSEEQQQQDKDERSMKGVREPLSEIAGIDWATTHSDRTNVAKPTNAHERTSTASYTVSTASSRSSYSRRPSHPLFDPVHSRGVSSSTSLPSSSHLHFPFSSTSSNPLESSSTTNISNIRPRESSLSFSRVRTPSNGSTASSASSDFPVTPAMPHSNSQRTISISSSNKGKGRDGSGDTWSTGLPVLGAGSPVNKGPSIVDPRFTFPRSGSRNQLNGSSRTLNQDSLSIGPFGEVRRSSEDRASNEKSFIASLDSKPFVDPRGQELPLFSTSPPPAQTSYLPTSPLQSAFAPPSPFSPTSPVTSIAPAEARPAISNFLPHFTPSTPSKSSSKSPSSTPKRRSTSFTRRVRRRSSPRKSNSRHHRRTSSSTSLSPHRRHSSRSSSTQHQSPVRHRSYSVPDLRSLPTPIPFDTFSPRSPYAHERSAGKGGGNRRPSIADELLFGDSMNRIKPTVSLEGNESVVFPSRKSSTAQKGKGKVTEEASEPLSQRSRSAPLDLARIIRTSPSIPPRSTLSPLSRIGSRRPSTSQAPIVKGSLIVPRPKVVVSDTGGDDFDTEHNSIEAIQRRYREGRLGGGGARGTERVETLASVESISRSVIEDDQESIDHSSVLRVLRENEESRKEREAWSDSATRTLGLGLGLKLAEFERRRGPGNIAFGGGGGSSRAKDQRRKARKRVEMEKQRRAAESGTDGEGGHENSPRRRRLRASADDSPPMPHSFEPFVQLGKKLSLSRSKSRDLALLAQSGKEEDGNANNGAMKKEASLVEAPSTPRTVRGKPIRHLRTSPSVDSIYSRSGGPPLSDLSRTNSTTQYGQALSLNNESAPLNGEHRRPSLTNQNAFLSLPPHLHHLLRSPERESYEPSRAPPIPPSAQISSSLSKDSNRLSTSSVASAARLSLALESKLSQSTPPPSVPQVINSKTPELIESRLSRSTSTPALLCDSSDRVSPDHLVDKSTVRPATTTHSLSPLPEVESPESQRSANSYGLSDASSGLEVDNRNEWKELFFSPPTRRLGSSVRGLADPTVTIQVASDDESSTSGTDDTFSIHKLERTRKSLEALFNPQAPSDPENTQETLLSPTSVAPTISRSTSEMSSAQASFVTAQESISGGGGDEAKTPLQAPTSRPLATPAQTPWASTSFAREYFGTDNIVEEPRSNRHSLASKRAASRASQSSFIDFDADETTVPSVNLEPSASPLSFLDDFSPPSSAPPSPAIDSFPTFSAGPTPQPSFAAVPPLDPASLPTSPTLSSTFGETDSNRFSRLLANRDSYLSVDSNNLHISPTAAKFVNGGTGDNTPRTHSYNSSRSNVLLNSFPVPPVEEAEERGSDGDDEEEAEEDERDLLTETKVDESDEPTLRFDSPTISSPHFATSEDVEALSTSPKMNGHAHDRRANNSSFLDVSDPSDCESKRFSRSTFRTFYSGPANEESIPPLPSFRP